MYEPLFQHPGMRILQRAIRREQYRELVAFAMLMVAGLVFCCLAFQNNALIMIAGTIFTVLGAAALGHIYKNWNNSWLLQLLRYQPRQLVWIYAVTTRIAPFGICLFRRETLIFKLSNGEEVTVSVAARYVPLVCRTLSRLLPYTTFGYTREREAQFRKSPLSLRKDNV